MTDYKSILRYYLLSKKNVDFIVNKLMTNFKISYSAISKCTKIVIDNLTNYLENIDRFPENNEELIDAINFLNKKCYEDFFLYLTKKYPNTEILRYPNGSFDIPLSLTQDDANTKEEYEEIIILNEKEKNALIDKFQLCNGGNNRNVFCDFLSFLSNPDIFTIVCNMISKTNTNEIVIIDEILDHDQVQKMLSYYKNNNISLKSGIDENNKDNKISQKESIRDVCPLEDKIEGQNNITKKKDIESQDLKTSKIDLANLNNEMLPLIKERIDELLILKNKFQKENDFEMVNKIDNEKKEIMDAIIKYKEKMENPSGNRFEKEKNTEYLDLRIDPTKDYNDLKNITIEFKSDNRVKEIFLIDYYIPANCNNITRFNNQFNVYFDGNLYRIIVPPGKYDIITLLDYLKNQVNFLDFQVDEGNLVTIKSTSDTNFDLITDGDTIFPVLGFVDRTDNYKGKTIYTSKTMYDLDCNEKVFFSLSGTTIDPFPLEFDKHISVNKCLKKSSAGIAMKRLVLKFTNRLNQYYDLMVPFNICLKIVYCE